MNFPDSIFNYKYDGIYDRFRGSKCNYILEILKFQIQSTFLYHIIHTIYIDIYYIDRSDSTKIFEPQIFGKRPR